MMSTFLFFPFTRSSTRTLDKLPVKFQVVSHEEKLVTHGFLLLNTTCEIRCISFGNSRAFYKNLHVLLLFFLRLDFQLLSLCCLPLFFSQHLF